MGGWIIRAAVVVLLSLIFRLFLKNIFNLRLSHGTELLQSIAHGCGAWIEAPVTLTLPFSSPRSISQKKERDGYKSAKNVQRHKEHKVYSG
jgi:H+/Cl- antiporter ClcA